MLSRGKKLHQMRLMKKRNQVDMKVVNGVENRAPPSILDCYIFKTLLQHYFYKEGVRHLDYETINEGTEHEPSFRSTVIANNVRYDSLPGFSDPVEAEHSAAEVALIVLANSPDTRSRLSELMLTSGVGKNRLALYCQKMNYAPPMYECVGEPGNFCSFVVVGGIKYAGFVEHTEREADISACRTALTAIESAARASEDNIRNSIFTVVPQRNKVSDPGDFTQSRQGPTKTYCSSQGTTAETMEPERISIKMDCSFQDTAMLKYPFKDDVSQNTIVAALEPKKGLVEIGCSGTTGTRLDVMVDCSSRGATAGALKPQENLAKKNTDAIDSGMAVIGISTNKTDLALKPKRCQMKRMQKKKNCALVMNCSAQGTTAKALEPREDLVAINCSSKCTIDAGLMVKMDGQAAEVGRISQEKAVVSSSDVNIEDNKAAIDSGMGVVSISTQENEAALTLSKTQRRRMTRIRSKARKMEGAVLGLKMANNLEISEARQTGVVGVDAILKPNPKNRQRRNSALKTDSSTPGTNCIGLDVRIDGRAALESPTVEINCLKVGSSENGLAAIGTGANSSFSDQGISAQQTVIELEPQKKWPVKTDYLSQGTTNAGFEVKLDCLSQGTQETDAAMKPSKGQMKRIRLKRNRALRKEAAVESTITEPVVCQMANNSEICKARQMGVIGADAVLKSNPRKRQKRNPTLNTNSSTAGMSGVGLNVRIEE